MATTVAVEVVDRDIGRERDVIRHNCVAKSVRERENIVKVANVEG